ncbi:glutamate--cysteine ligase, chloroplastic-like isoform X2 [Phoenix dactylifera]|uniref:Glutamate--cysteine ligase n=1 Tax=Phoenix dactylifera TaxID=42345 RepID=A0A8B7MUF0_PHODC|nr:glutamate--cysteine ligase, chloroplastic-like isoform X2 [Phoenix dactylifera]
MAIASRLPLNRVHRSEMLNYTGGVECDVISKDRQLRVRRNVMGFRNMARNVERRSQGLRFDVVGSRRGQRMVVAASPPTEDAVVTTEPLTKEDLVRYLASGCKPKEKWRIGTEHEKFGFEVATLRPINYEQIADLLNGISERFDWDKVMEGDYVIGLKQGKQSISLEPGGQFELSGAPLETLHQTCAEVKAVAEELGIGFLGIGFQPKWELKDIPIMPKGRYDIMRKYMPKVGSLGHDMMFRTCTVQVNLDFSSELDMIRKFRAALALQPIATAVFANSPFTEGKPNGYLSMRSHVWTDTDNNRAGMLPFVFDDSSGFEQYVEYALDVPMYFVYRNKKYIDCTGMSFRDFMVGKLPSIPGELPTLNDWENHLTTIFPEVRLKRYLEMRGADGGPWRRLCALPAFWVGLLYDEVSLQNVLDMIADWTEEERQMLREKVTITGLKTPFRDGLLRHVAEDVLKLAKDGLERRCYKEAGFLNEVTEVVRTGVTPAEKLLELYHGKWGCSVDPVFEELLY